MNEFDLKDYKINRMSIVIEKAVPENAETICDIRDRAWLESYPNPALGITEEDIRLNAQGLDGVFVPRRIAHIQDRLSSLKDESNLGIFVAKAGDKVVGYVDPIIDEDGRKMISAIYVAPEVQGEGIGSLLMKRALVLHGYEEDIFLEVVSYNEKAINFYKKFGFEHTDAIVPEDENRPSYMKTIPMTVMVLRKKNST